MKDYTIIVEVAELRLPLKHTVRHAAKSRKEGESIWVKLSRNSVSGFGEGCPRDYVAGDELGSSIEWVKETFCDGKLSISSVEALGQWVGEHESVINVYPSAWCAVEMALLDLLAREKKVSVENLLGIEGNQLKGKYCAVLGDDKEWKFLDRLDRFLIRGISDFKVKLNGDLETDRDKLKCVQKLAVEHDAKDFRVRFDANNLWKHKTDDAIKYIKTLGGGFFAVEEPVTAKDATANSRFSSETDLPVILDESLCTFDDFNLYRTLPGQYIANIKVSRVGGLIRAMKLIDAAKKEGWQIIIGCHVGETSLLTRAGLVAAAYAGDNLISQEGAFGDYLIEHEPAEPMLKFGRDGILDLNQTYYLKTVYGLSSVLADNWQEGFGLKCRMPHSEQSGDPEINELMMPDDYGIHSRLWGGKTGDDVLVILHGGMSHSGWQAPLAKAFLSKNQNISITALDRRGCGLNEKKGDLGTVDLVISDVENHIRHLKKSFKRVHLAGWCQGAQYASIVAANMGGEISNLILLTPGFFWNERFRSVLRMTEQFCLNMISSFKIHPSRYEAKIPIPMEASDFTSSGKWLDFIEKDTLKMTMLTLKSAAIMEEIQELSWAAVFQNQLPMLAVIAENDRIVDNNKFQQVVGPLFENSPKNRLFRLESGHAIQFEQPDEVADMILDFIFRNAC